MIKNPTAMHRKSTEQREQKDVKEMKLLPTQLLVVSTIAKPTFTQNQVNQPKFCRINESNPVVGDEGRLSEARVRNLMTCESLFPSLYSEDEFRICDILLKIFDPGGMWKNEQRPRHSKFLVCVVLNLLLMVNDNSYQFNISVKYYFPNWNYRNFDFGAVVGNVCMEDHRSNEAEYDIVWLCCKAVKHIFSIYMNDRKFCLIMKPKEKDPMVGMIMCQAVPLTPKELEMDSKILCKSYYINGRVGMLGNDLDGYSMNLLGITHVKVTNVIVGLVWQLRRILLMAGQTWFKEQPLNLMTSSQEANQLICNVEYQRYQMELTKYCVLMNNLAMRDGLDNDKYAGEEKVKLATIDKKPHASAKLLTETGGLVVIFDIQRNCFFQGYDQVISSLVHNVIEVIGTICRLLESFSDRNIVVLIIIMVELELNFNLDGLMKNVVKADELLPREVIFMSFHGHWNCNFYITRGRVISLVGWNDENNANMGRKFILVEISVIVDSCLNTLCKNEQLKKALKLFFRLVNGLDPPFDVDGKVMRSLVIDSYDFARGRAFDEEGWTDVGTS